MLRQGRQKKMAPEKIKAIALLSGGLDSLLAAKLILEQGIEVIGLHFSTPFGEPTREVESIQKVAQNLGIELVVLPKAEEFLELVRNPRFGYGKNLNPCVDCRIWTIQKAWEYAQEVGAQFIITGEVMGQRPKSQHKRELLIVDRESGISGRILRPLSAKLLPPTIPEQEGWVDREQLLDISGRSRARQVELGRAFGLIEEYYAGGGCPICEKNYAAKMRDYLAHAQTINMREVWLLKVGRHFRFDDAKIIVGRNQEDNNELLEFAQESGVRFEVEGIGSPVTLLLGPQTDQTIQIAAALTARYSDATGNQVEVSYGAGALDQRILVTPADNDLIEEHRIG